MKSSLRKSKWVVHLCAFALPLGVSAPAVATQPLDAFLEQAKTQSFDVREVAATERQRVEESDVAFARLIPALSARGVYTRNQDEVAATLPPAGGGEGRRLVISPLNQLDAFLQLDVPIVDLTNYHRYKSAQSLARGAAEQREATSIDVSRGVARAYYQFLGASALVEAAQKSVTAADDNRKSVEARRSEGAATELDHERASASVARAEQNLADASLGVALAARGLETLSGLTPETAQDFPDDDLHEEGPIQHWLQLAGNTPNERVARHASDALRENEKAVTSALLPTLSASAQERITNATGFAGRSATYTLQLILAWHLDYSLPAVQAAQVAALEAQQVRVSRAERAVLDAAFEAYHRVAAGIVKSRSARVEANAAARAAELSLDRYGAGVSTQLEVTEAQRDAFQAAAARIQADAELAYSRVALRLAVGQPISQSAVGQPIPGSAVGQPISQSRAPLGAQK